MDVTKHIDCVQALLQPDLVDPHMSFTLGQVVHGHFMPGVCKAHYQRILARLNSNKAWTASAQHAACCFHIAGPGYQFLAGEPFDALVQTASGAAVLPTEHGHVFQHKLWRFVLGQAAAALVQDRDDDRDLVHQVQLQLVLPPGWNYGKAGNRRYVAESGLMLVQDLCDMVTTAPHPRRLPTCAAALQQAARK